jgi:UDP-N-acetyl-D-galactosamine dehydrogenase
MGVYIASKLVKAMIRRKIQVEGARVLIMGLTFKENCPDLRNTRVVDIINELKDYNCQVDVFDPWVINKEASDEYNISTIIKVPDSQYHAIVLAVAHDKFKDIGINKIKEYGRPECIIFDVKSMFDSCFTHLRL